MHSPNLKYSWLWVFKRLNFNARRSSPHKGEMFENESKLPPFRENSAAHITFNWYHSWTLNNSLIFLLSEIWFCKYFSETKDWMNSSHWVVHLNSLLFRLSTYLEGKHILTSKLTEITCAFAHSISDIQSECIQIYSIVYLIHLDQFVCSFCLSTR